MIALLLWLSTVSIGPAAGKNGSVWLEPKKGWTKITVRTSWGDLQPGTVVTVTYDRPHSARHADVWCWTDLDSSAVVWYLQGVSRRGYEIAAATPLEPNTDYTFWCSP